MNYRRPILPWVIATMFFVGAAVLGVLAWYGVGPRGGVAWGIAAVVEAAFGIIIVVVKSWYVWETIHQLKNGPLPASRVGLRRPLRHDSPV